MFAFLLPFHALLVTVLKCRFGVNTDVLRFWKEFVVIGLLGASVYSVGKRYKWKFSKFFEDNFIVWTSVTFAIVAFIYIFFPYFNPWLHAFLGYKYDVFFIFCLIIGYSLISIRTYFDDILKALFTSIALIMMIFLPWYIFFDISAVTNIFGYSSEVSTYIANQCISFSQNVEWEHRFQWTFWWPIRFSVFLTVWLFVYVWFILDKKLGRKKNLFLIVPPAIGVFLSVYFSYSKTSILGLIVGIFVFFVFMRKYVYGKDMSEKQEKIIKFAPLALIATALVLVLANKDLFTHLWSMINRLDNLQRAVGTFLYNPIGRGLWTAWPATQLHTESIEWFTIKWAINSEAVYKFLPENWYVQIMVEMSYVGIFLFLWILFAMFYSLFMIMKKRKDFFSVWMLVAFLTLCFMANFTHAFEETATSYLLFLMVWAYIAKYNGLVRKKK